MTTKRMRRRRQRTISFFVLHLVFLASSTAWWNNMAVQALAFNMKMTASTTTPTDNPQKVAVVTGASRGIGRGIAVELGSNGYTVYCLGRTSRNDGKKKRKKTVTPNQRPVAEGLDVTVESAAEEVTRRGGRGVGVPCDLTQDGAIESILENVNQTEGRLDLLVCAAYATPAESSAKGLRAEFWKQSMDMWDTINGLGLRQVYAACRAAAPYMIETAATTTTQTTPLLCLVSSFGGKSKSFNVAYGVGKAAVDRLASDMSYELKPYGVATTALYPGVVKTEANLQMVVDGIWDEASGGLNLALGESPEFSGRAVAQLASLYKETLLERSGNVEVVAELATEFGFTDIDGSQPPSIRSLKFLLPNFVFPQVEAESGKPIPAWIKKNVPDILLPWSTFASGPPPEADS